MIEQNVKFTFLSMFFMGFQCIDSVHRGQEYQKNGIRGKKKSYLIPGACLKYMTEVITNN